MDLFQKFLVQAALSRDDRTDQVTGLGHGFAAIGVTLSQSKQIVITRVESRAVQPSPSIPPFPLAPRAPCSPLPSGISGQVRHVLRSLGPSSVPVGTRAPQDRVSFSLTVWVAAAVGSVTRRLWGLWSCYFTSRSFCFPICPAELTTGPRDSYSTSKMRNPTLGFCHAWLHLRARPHPSSRPSVLPSRRTPAVWVSSRSPSE